MPQNENTAMDFVCAGGSTNPPSHVLWQLDGDNITENVHEEHLPGDHNSDYVHSRLELTATRQMNGHELKCSVLCDNKGVAMAVLPMNVTCELYLYLHLSIIIPIIMYICKY